MNRYTLDANRKQEKIKKSKSDWTHSTKEDFNCKITIRFWILKL